MSRRTPWPDRVIRDPVVRSVPKLALIVILLVPVLVFGASGCSQVARELNGGARSGVNPARPGTTVPAVVVNRDARPVAALAAADWDVSGGHFFTQTNGMPELASPTGFAVTDGDGIPFWSEFQRLGGVQALGFPLSPRLTFQNRVTQVFQRGIFQWNAQERIVQPMNVLYLLDEAGKADWLTQKHQVPARLGADFDQGRDRDAAAKARLALLSSNAALEGKFRSAPDPIALYGLPDSRVVDQGDHFAVRFQRNILRVWKQDMPWAKSGEATADNSGAYAIEAGLFPAEALSTEQPATAPRRANVPGLVVQGSAATPVPAQSPASSAVSPTASVAGAAQAALWQVANTSGDGVWLRRTPKLEDKINAWQDGAIMKGLNEQSNAEGLSWQKVQAPDGNVGWIPTKFLRAMP